MRAIESLTEPPPRIGATEREGPGIPAWRGRLAEIGALLAPIALIFGVALGGGGFELGDRHIAGLAVWLVVVGLLVFGGGASVRVPNPLYWGMGLTGGLALLSATSSFWSGSTELSVIEADRVLVYLGILLAAFLIAQTRETRQRFAEGLAIGVTLVALLALISRLLPHLLDVTAIGDGGRRLRYPLGYWNANGAMFGMGVVLLMWMSRRATHTALRWASVAAIPIALLALYLTYSRGGVFALVVGAVCLLALSHDRLWLLGTLTIGVLATVPAVLGIQARTDLENNIVGGAGADQGATVALILLAGIAGALLAYAGLRAVERRGGRLTEGAVKASRNPALLTGIAIFAVAFLVAAAVAIGGQAWDQFSKSDIQLPSQPAQHFTDFTGSGRRDFWRVAVDAFGEKPILGQGAGTYEFSWDQHRSIDVPVHDAHSLYLEAFAELGAVGGILVLAMVGTLLAFGFRAWRGSRGDEQERNAVLLAVMISFALSAGLDWFWELAGLGAVFFLAGGAVLRARSEQLAAEDEMLGIPDGERRYGVVVLGLVLAWISAAALVAPLLVDHELKLSQEAAADGDVPSAINHADSARSIEPWAASPYVQLALLEELRGNYGPAIERFTEAIDREDGNWQLYFLRSRVESESGDDAAAAVDLAKARELNPLAPELKSGAGQDGG